ncbi:ABC transporter permease [Gluconacetobacter tumulisoli]|uniref:ABC transporter permease n=1 Tax=Gluconacetobacter tumulisoli TaxID=1286189 RepID=UPI001C7ED51A
MADLRAALTGVPTTVAAAPSRPLRAEALLAASLLTPALLLVALLLLVPLLWLVWQSVRQDGGFTLAHYARLFTDPAYGATFLQTFRISAIVTLACVVLGFPVAWAAAESGPTLRTLILALVVLPLWTSVLVRAYAWIIVLQRTGLVNSALEALGVIHRPVILVNNEFGTIVATTHILMPFVVLPLYTTIRTIPREVLAAAASLGGTPAFVFTRVYLPLSLPGLLSGASLVCVLSLGFYITPELLGGGRTYTVSMLIARNIALYDEWGAASSVSVALLACIFLIFFLAGRIVPIDRIVGTR